MAPQQRSRKRSSEGNNNENKKKKKETYELSSRCNPKQRGIHPNAIQAGRAPTSAASCVDCGKTILKGDPRWGIQYAGNPLPSEPVLPLYGSHPMYLWNHAHCGLAYTVLTSEQGEATRTCHACEDVPSAPGSLRLLCGGSAKGNKIRHHAFHIACWKRAMQAAPDDDSRKALLVGPDQIGISSERGLSWKDLSVEQKELARKEFNQ